MFALNSIVLPLAAANTDRKFGIRYRSFSFCIALCLQRYEVLRGEVWSLALLLVRVFVSAPFEPRHDKTNKMAVRPAKTQIRLGMSPLWSESSLSAWRNLGSLATHWAHSEDSDQSGRMPRLIWVFAGRTLILLVLSCRGSFNIRITSLREEWAGLLVHLFVYFICVTLSFLLSS